MAHYPVNHPLRPFYRVLTFLIGAYVLAFGILGATRTWGQPAFDRHGTWVLLLRTNLAFAILSIVTGAVVLACALVDGRLLHFPLMVIGWIFVGAGFAAMAVMQTRANVFALSMVNALAMLVFGLLLIAAGLYSQTGNLADTVPMHRLREAGADVSR
ncbi:DUF4383 domain-containing protein [Rhizomonospora bruguierae]|uniref:DUF4383 domain-containing protein n=1 Tax=Rhizomonospora bruguierae TaxID=1581705 RepID=UPI001BCC5D9C|nr:DUF4383 domain-containing protein [Micromonospora sp. NBRC 107566]